MLIANKGTMRFVMSIMPKKLSPPACGPLLAALALSAFINNSLHAEDVIVTGCIGAVLNTCQPSCPADLGTMGLHSSFSTAVPAGAARSKTLYGTANTATWWVTPALASNPSVYRVYVSKGTTYDCPTDIVVKLVATSGCTLADTNYVSQSAIETPAFQRDASLNVWSPVAVITNTTTTPTIIFSWASGGCSRWYMDEVRFENLAVGTATPARITQLFPGNPLVVVGTGPVSHPFALVSSSNAEKPLNQWTPEQTNGAGTGSFFFSVTPGAEKARFFRVITQ
jgi:hypothetical protein